MKKIAAFNVIILIIFPCIVFGNTFKKSETVYANKDFKLYSQPIFQGTYLETVYIGATLSVLNDDGSAWVLIKTEKGNKGYTSYSYLTRDIQVKIDADNKSLSKIKQHQGEKRKKIKELDEKVKPIPASDIVTNLKIYKQLLYLDPKNQKYQNKVAYYQSKIPEGKIISAFGMYLGESVDLSSVKCTWPLKFIHIPICEFRPDKKNHLFDRYYYGFVPKSRKVCIIIAVGNAKDKLNCESNKELLMSVLRKKYGNKHKGKMDKEVRETLESLFDLSNKDIIAQKESSVMVRCGNFLESLEITYIDYELFKIAEKEGYEILGKN